MIPRQQFAERRPAGTFEALEAFGRALTAAQPAAQARLLRQALAAAPQFHEARLALGRVQLEAGEFSAAHATLARVPARRPWRAARASCRASRSSRSGATRRRRDIYAAPGGEQPTPAVLNNQAPGRCCATRAAGRAHPTLLRRAWTWRPDSVDITFNLGWALLLEGDPGAAEFFLREAGRSATRWKGTRGWC